MRFFVDHEHVRSLHLAQIHDGSMFDDSITYDNGMLMYEKPIKGGNVKQPFMDNGSIFCRHLASGSFVKMSSLNLSWMPKYVFQLLL